jgi:hypothetical protein
MSMTKTAAPSAAVAKLRAEALANGWDLTALLTKAAGLDDQQLTRALVVMKSHLVAVQGIRRDRPLNSTDTIHGIPQWAWKAILETEAELRGTFPMSVTVKDPEKRRKKKDRRISRAPAAPKEGRLASEVTSAKEIRRIWKACRVNGGDLAYEGVEEKFGLRPARGMTALRICQKHEKRSKK